jgi:hypothetical protein
MEAPQIVQVWTMEPPLAVTVREGGVQLQRLEIEATGANIRGPPPFRARSLEPGTPCPHERRPVERAAAAGQGHRRSLTSCAAGFSGAVPARVGHLPARHAGDPDVTVAG